MGDKLMLGVAIAFALVSLCNVATGFEYMPDFPGPYCERRQGGCCDNRKDVCSMPISTTLCYCDAFCDKHVNGDCCPDYESFCLGIAPEPIKQGCNINGNWVEEFGSVVDNCNVCKCYRNSTECERDICLVDDALLKSVNQYDSGWRATKYTEFWGYKYSKGLELRLGTFEPARRVKAMSKLTSQSQAIPLSFASADKWPGSISDVEDQGWCASSWAVSTASVASDRFAIHSKGKEAVDLSPQQLLSCVRKQQGCRGGHLDTAWNYIRKFGLVDDECYPYIAAVNKCKIHRSDSLQSAGCRVPYKVPRTQLYKTGPAYMLNNETDIMLEIMDSGPVQATMRVYRDFFSYGGGIYRHVARGNEPSGFHSVRIVGWGEERSGYGSTKYWVAANSWGTWWGEQGYFRILRGVNECEIENYVLASWPHLFYQNKI